ncbi:MAG: BTAD domain-containing putative transcriptional regulator [Labedaea sp.]
MTVEFRLLGDFEMNVDGAPVTIGYAQLRSVLAVLLVEANRTVPVDQLVDRIWRDRRMPRRPRGAVQHNVTLLRNALVAARDVTIAWRSPGYRLIADPDTIDLHRFRALVSQAKVADHDRAAPLLEQALRLWRGEPFGGLDSGWLESLRATLAQQHLAARLDFNDFELHRGRHAGMVAELADWVRRNPLDERLAGQYLTALCRNGQQAAALAHFEQLRGLLAEQLGADPSAPLRELHRRILVADPMLAGPPVGSPAGPAPCAVPRQLPARPRLFSGRDREIARLTAALDDAGGPDGALVVCAIGGPGGMGKTWLALHWAHQHLHRFPDGQLHVNLRGFDPSGEPVPPEAALREFLEALGVAATAIPSGVDARAARYRSLVAGRRMLILLDNARDAAQVVPLLPGSPSCCVLVTSRQRLTGLVVAHGAHPVELDLLTGRAASDLLVGHLGHDRVAREPDAVARLLSFCAGLPLAISIVAARAAVSSELSLSALAGELRVLPGLAAMDTGDTSTSLRATLSWSHRALPPAPAEVFGLLGLAPGPDIGVAAAASLAGMSVVDTEVVLRCLQDASLVRQQTPGRFRMHDLVRRYAADSATPLREAPLRRLVDHYLHTAFAAARLLDPHRQPIRLAAPAAGAHTGPVPDEQAALAWLSTEHANLLACQRMAAERGWHAPVWQLAWTLETFHWRGGQLQQARAMWQAGLAAAEALGDLGARISCHQRLGNACAPLGRHIEALHHLRQALALAERSGEHADQAHTHHILAWVWEEMGDDHRALEHADRAVGLFRAVGRPAWEANALNTAGWYHARLGHHEQAREHCTAALALFDGGLDPQGEAATLDTLGYVAHHTGQHDQSRTYYGRALTLFRDLGYAYEEANTLAQLGRTHRALGEFGAARSALRQALDLYQAQHREPDADRVRGELDLLDSGDR